MDCYWIFTFGAGQPHAGNYVKVKGSWAEARKKMIDKYGTKWAFQYSEEEWNSFDGGWWPKEIYLETIE